VEAITKQNKLFPAEPDCPVRFPYKFFIFTFIWSWIIWIFIALWSNGIIPGYESLKNFKYPLAALGAFGPMAGALFSLRKNLSGESIRDYLKRCLDLKIGWKAYVFPIVIFGGITFISWILPEFSGEDRLPMLLPSLWIFIPCLIFMMFLGGGQEEFGWRGYALPILEQKYGIWLANIILGLIWAFWHIPLWFIEGTTQVYMNYSGFVLFSVGCSLILSWFMRLSDNKPFAGIYAHGLANAFIAIMPVIVLQKHLPQPRYWIWVVSTLLVGIIITVYRKDGTLRT
jgi:hypothetical protein